MNALEPSAINRRVLLSALTVLPALSGLLRPIVAAAQAAATVAPTATAPSQGGLPLGRHGLLVGAVAVAAIVLDGHMAPAQEMQAQDLAAQLRVQGYRCDEPVTAQRDARLSRPDEAVWNLSCRNASYRMRLIPDLAARIEQLK